VLEGGGPAKPGAHRLSAGERTNGRAASA
jgi:hypothetical protein